MSNDCTIDEYRWLTGEEADIWLKKAAAERSRPGFSQVRLTAQVRAELPAAKARLVLEQVELRRRGSEKFATAGSMFFTPLGLEQSTDELVASYKAGRFPAGGVLADLCCGIGGDAIALGRRRTVLAVDRDAVCSVFVEANLRAHDDAKVHSAEIEADFFPRREMDDVTAWHIDPDRRSSGYRTTRTERYEPSPKVIQSLLAIKPNGAIKLAPAADIEDGWWRDAELEWISRGRHCRQCVAWFGDLAEYPKRRRATIVGGELGGRHQVVASFVGDAGEETDFSDTVGRYIYEPDAAVLAAKLEGSLACAHQLSAIAGGVAYFSGDQVVDNAALAGFEVLAVMPYDVKRLKSWLAQRRIGRLEIKKRGVPLEPERVRRDLRTTGDEQASVLLARIGGRITAICCRRLKQSALGAAEVTPG